MRTEYTKPAVSTKINAGVETQKVRYNVSTPSEYTQNGEVKTFWNNVGSAFPTAKGFTIMLNALPVNGKLFINTSTENN